MTSKGRRLRWGKTVNNEVDIIRMLINYESTAKLLQEHVRLLQEQMSATTFLISLMAKRVERLEQERSHLVRRAAQRTKAHEEPEDSDDRPRYLS